MENTNKKRFYIIISLMLILTFSIVLWMIKENQISNTMTEEAFKTLDDVDIEIIDTSVFVDKGLESWYNENRKVEGVYTYHVDDNTYILVSAGEVNDKDTFLLLNGVKKQKDKLAVSYETITLKEVPEIDFEDNTRSTLIKVKGKHDKVNVVKISH